MPAYADSILSPTHGGHSTQGTQNRKVLATPLIPEVEVVISGMSGRFPESSSVDDFSKNLYGGIDMITEDDRRWMPGIYGLPTRSGKLVDLRRFDAPFFSVSPRQAHCMDPQLRLLLEVTYEALFDAGIHPSEMRGKKVGVYVGTSVSESEDFFSSDPESISGYELTGCCRAMFANRLSYALDFKGPSFAIDTACSSSMVAFTNAWAALKSGEIEAAIVAGSNLTLKPQSSMQFNALSMLSVDGCCKSFDAGGNGYVRSEAVAAILLQRSDDARRTYADVIQARMNTDGFKSKGITFPSGEMQKNLLQEVYLRSGISPSSVSYVEAHGTGTKAGDPQEVNSIAEVLCHKERNEPLLMGSVKSNMGHAEAASGLCSIIKVLLAMQRREIPANLHYKSPNLEIPSLVDGRIKVVNANTPWKGGYAAVNSFGFGGANVHLLLKSHDEPLRSFSPEEPISHNSLTQDDLPRLILASGRTEAAVEYMLNEVNRTKNGYLATLLDKISPTSLTLHPFRGFSLMKRGDQVENTPTKVTSCPSSKAPIWLVFTGMGSQWTGCGCQLLQIPTFAKAIHRCRIALLPYDIDILDIITRLDPNPMTSSSNSFTAIAAVQVGLVEVLRSIGLADFDGFLGHSVGELGCAYADGALTAEQTVLTAYWRGRAVEEAELSLGAMAAVGLSGEKAREYCGNGPVVVACYNSKDSATISGPKEEVENIKKRLESEDIFCRNVNSGGIAFHHSSLRKAAPRLYSELKKFIQTPHRRTTRWVSTSVPEDKWTSDQAAAASPEYFVNNLVSPVLFAQGLAKIPEGATVIEVSPHALLQAVLRRAIKDATIVPLIRKEAKDPLSHFLQSLGTLYASGLNINLSPIYSTDVRLPVPLDTPGISSLIKWDHDSEWDVATFTGSPPTSEFKLEVDLESPEFSYIEGHTIDGRVLFPATGYLVLVWRALAKLLGTQWQSTCITFEDVTLHQATVFSSNNSVVNFTVRILLSKGEFEVLSGETVAVSGKVHAEAKKTPERKALMSLIMNSSKKRKPPENNLKLEKEEVYKELKLRGYEYGGIFKGIEKAYIDGSQSQLSWQSNWVSFLDTMLQASLLGATSRGLCLPTRIRKVIIEPLTFEKSLPVPLDDCLRNVEVFSSRNLNITACPGIEIYGLKATMAPRRAIQDEPLLETYKFFPRFLMEETQLFNCNSAFEALKLITDLLIENSSSLKLKVMHIMTEGKNTDLELDANMFFPQNISKIFASHPQLALNYSIVGKDIAEDHRRQLEEADISIQNALDESSLEKQHLLILPGGQIPEGVTDKLSNNAFVLCGSDMTKDDLKACGFIDIACVAKYHLHLLRKPKISINHSTINISDRDFSFAWLEELKKRAIDGGDEPIWLLSKGEPLSGILGMFNCLRKELGGERLRCFIDANASSGITKDYWKSIFEADLAVNILSDETLGSMRHIELPPLSASLSQHAYLNVLTRGDLSSLTWLRGAPPNSENGEKTILSNVHYAPLNFRDIMLASGKLPPDALPGGLAQKDCVLGLEFAGVSEDSSRVMGLVPAGGLATSIRSDPLLTWKVPSTWSLKEASTVPVVYATAYYALVLRGSLRRGESILIHAGSGGVGQAAISIALSRNCRVFTTVSSEKKKSFLKEKFPQLTDDSFANSRDGSFEYDILERTEGEGVDLVLNSLAGELLQASVRCLKEHGRFLEIGKADLANNTALGMSVFLKNVTFHGILLDSLFNGMKEERKRIQALLYEGMIIGEVAPLPATCYSWDAAEEAFRFMASGKHIGKVVLEITSQNGKKINLSSPSMTVPSVYRFWPKQNLVYIITGGLGGLGLELCNWLIARGASKLVLTSRRGITTGYQALCMRRWKSSGADVRVLKQDASTLEGAEKLITVAAGEGSIGGIFHLAMILEDSILENQSAESFQRVCQVKANGAIALDQASRRLCPQLHVWVTFSSVACGRGNPGQSNYGWANSVSEKVVVERVKDGLPGVAIQWGGIGDVGVLASTLGNVEVGGTRPQSVRSVLSCLDHLIGNGGAVVSSLCLASRRSGKDAKGSKSLVAAVANVLGIRDISKAPPLVSLGDLGLDSLMGVEIKQILEREADVVLSPEAIRDLTLTRLQEIENGSQGQEATDASLTTTQTNIAEKRVSWIEYPLVPRKVLYSLNERKESSVPPLFILSPMQGNCELLREAAENVHRRVYGLQYTPGCPCENIPDLASHIIKNIEKEQPEGDVYLAGYSYGACIAVEIVRQLEEKRRKVASLILLDGSHSYVSSVIRFLYANKLNISTKELPEGEKEAQIQQGETEVLVLYSLQLCPLDAIQLRNDLMQKKSWEEKASHTATAIFESIGKDKVQTLKLTIKEVKQAARLFFLRMKAAFEHDVSTLKIHTKTLLVRAGQNTHADLLAHDYGLSEVIEGDIKVEVIPGTHESFIVGKSAQEVARHINEFTS